jgi:hypothetical protein
VFGRLDRGMAEEEFDLLHSGEELVTNRGSLYKILEQGEYKVRDASDTKTRTPSHVRKTRTKGGLRNLTQLLVSYLSMIEYQPTYIYELLKYS